MRGGTIYREVEFGGSYQRGSVTLIDLDCCGHCNGTLEATFYLTGVIVLSSLQRHTVVVGPVSASQQVGAQEPTDAYILLLYISLTFKAA